jgi:hypothetical protein
MMASNEEPKKVQHMKDGSTIRFKRSSTNTYVVLTRDEYTRLLGSPEVKEAGSLAADVWMHEYLPGF